MRSKPITWNSALESFISNQAKRNPCRCTSSAAVIADFTTNITGRKPITSFAVNAVIIIIIIIVIQTTDSIASTFSTILATKSTRCIVPATSFERHLE